jgi:Uma2 family endonuclease
MAALRENLRYTVEEYFAIDRASEFKNEYIDGEILAMTGAKPNHILITASTITTLSNQLVDRCNVFTSDLRVKISESAYVYPDITVVCGEPEYDVDGLNLLNPTLVVEVLSPSTEGYDRGRKFEHYQKRDSLQEYVLIAQDAYRIEGYARQSDNQWLYTEVRGRDAVLDLRSVAGVLRLADVYRQVTFA